MNDIIALKEGEHDGDVYRDVGRAIRAARARAGLTLGDLAERAGLSAAYVGQVERDVRKASLQTLSKLAKALNISLALFFTPPSPVPSPDRRHEPRDRASLDALIATSPAGERAFLVAAVRHMSRGLARLRRGDGGGAVPGGSRALSRGAAGRARPPAPPRSAR